MKTNLRCWFDSCTTSDTVLAGGEKQIDWVQNFPYLLLHLSCFAVFWVGFSWIALVVAIALYMIRMFAITAFYHRYFSHRAFQTTRFWQFIFAVLGNSAAQRGPLWWAAYHRLHHRHTDTDNDVHSPIHHGFWWSHLWWFTTKDTFKTPLAEVKDFAKYSELRLLDRFSSLVPLALAAGIYGLGVLLELNVPSLNTSGVQLLVWGFFISTVCQHHATFMINSLAHLSGTRRYQTNDNSQNNFLLALITFGEGWHNNHHNFPASARQGVFWWEIDITYEVLKVMAWAGIIWNLKKIPQQARNAQT